MNWSNHFVPFVAILIIGCFALIQLSRWPNRLRYPGEEDAAEGTQLSEVVHLRQGVKIYRNPSHGEFDGAIYGPICYLLGAAVVDPVHPSYFPLRLLSLVATLAVAALGAVFVFKVTGSRSGAALSVLTFFASAYICRYGISARADMVALLFSFAGFLIFYLQRVSRRALLLSAVLMLLSSFYKQQFVGAPIAVFLYLAFSKRFRDAAIFAGAIAGGGLLLLGAFSFVVFPHQTFLQHFLAYNHLPFEKDLIVPEILMFVIPLFVPLLAGADFLDHHPDKLVTSYAITASGVYFVLLFSSGSGADTNRCLEPALILSCLMAARIATAKGIFGGLAWTAALTFTLATVARLSTAFVIPQVQAQDFVADKALQTYLRQTFAPETSVLTYYPGDPIRAGLSAPITNLWHYSALIRNGKLSDHDIVSRIDGGGYGVILLDFDLAHASATSADFYTTPSVRDAILHSYKQAASLELPTPELTRYNGKNLYVWTPKASPGH